MTASPNQVIVVGGGLSGLSTAHTVLERGGRVCVLDKMPYLGGNSTKATSGINGALTNTQRKLGIPDSQELFYDDTARSARDLLRPELAKVLTYNSASAVEWLQEKFGLDLSLVSRLGGHSQPRTHRGKEKFPGMTITYALMEKLEEIATREPNRAQIIKKAKATRLITDPQQNVVGVEYIQDGKVHQLYGPVVLATGGYAADFTQDSLLQKHRPDIVHLPTTNGSWSTGDGLKMTLAIGGNAVDLEKVQVHPTGLVDPKEPESKVKFLAAEALRGVGGLLLDANGKRFCDELGHRDYVTGEMGKNKGPFRLVLNSKASKEIEWHCKHYVGRGLMKRFNSGADLAKEMGIQPSALEETFNNYNAVAKAGKDQFGKKFYHNVPFTMNDEFHVAIVTPVLHFTMGGIEIDHEGRVKKPSGVINGLFCAGEVAGGVHGANRLGGSSLLGCVVFGRVAGDSASRYLFSELSSRKPQAIQPSQQAANRVSAMSSQLAPATSVQQTVSTKNGPQIGAIISNGGVSTRVSVAPNAKRIDMQIQWDESVAQAGAKDSARVVGGYDVEKDTTSAMVKAPIDSTVKHKDLPVDPNKEWTWEEIAKHNTPDDCWVVVNGQVLDVTKFLAEHPGGDKAILIYAGKDATEEFNMLHKPDVVAKYAPYTIIGKIKGSSPAPAAGSHSTSPSTSSQVMINGKPLVMKPSDVESLESGGTASVLTKERAKATFDIEKLTNALDGGVENTKRRRFILSPTKGDDLSHIFELSRPELLKEHIAHFVKVHERFWKNFQPTMMDIAWMGMYSMNSGALMNSYGLFLQTVMAHGNDQQREWWVQRCREMKIVGCYAQTELGHGSNVRGLQTTATFNKKNQTFVLHTPTLRSIKWWPGALGKVATHGVVYAQLIIDGKQYGVHSFMLQLRDENHKPLPGISLGDLGTKLGDHANDTGYMILNNVEIPREYMLAKYQYVTPEGEYIVTPEKKKNAKLHYTTMIFTRGSMIKASGGYLARAVTVATRYSCIRTQGFENSRTKDYLDKENKIIDYQIQRYRVFKQLAMAYAINFTGTWMLSKFQEMASGKEMLANVELLPEIAATSSGLKAFCTYFAWAGIEDCRKCCGGNGYLLNAGLAPLAANYVWQITAEGDFIILMLQTGRYLLKSVQRVMKGELDPTSSMVSYLTYHGQQAPEATSEGFHSIDFLFSLIKYSAAQIVVSAAQRFQTKMDEKATFETSFNASALELQNAVRAHTYHFFMDNFVNAVNNCQDPAVKKALNGVCKMFALSYIVEDGNFIGMLNMEQVQMAKSALVAVMDELRDNAIALVDGFDIPDRVLNSTIGRSDGNIYEALFEAAQRSVLNQRDPFEGYETVLAPHLDKEFLKQANKVPKGSGAQSKL